MRSKFKRLDSSVGTIRLRRLRLLRPGTLPASIQRSMSSCVFGWVYVGVGLAIVARKEIRRGFATEITIDTLLVYVEFSWL